MRTGSALLLLLLACMSCAPAAADAKIDRKTFSMSLPKGWKEDTKDELYEPDSFVFFENSESCLFSVVIDKKSAGASLEAKLKANKQRWEEKYTDAKVTEFNKWSNYQGKGFEIEGKLQGTTPHRARVFGFEKDDTICVITEAAFPADFKSFAADFERIRQTFKLK